MSQLSDGTVLPSFLRPVDHGRASPGALLTMSDSVLRVGEITGAFYPDDSGNVSKAEVEYMVMVRRRDGRGKLLPTPYRCVMKDGFGSAGDHSRHSVRARSADQTNQEISDGAIVLIACINGDMAQGVILDCLRHPDRTAKDPKGRFYDFAFNGVGVDIKDDGSLTLTVAGPTDNLGKPNGAQPDRPTKVTFEADGSVTLDTAGPVKVNADKVTVTASSVTVESNDVSLGKEGLTPQDNGHVVGGGIDTFTGIPYFDLGNASATIKSQRP